MFINPGLKNELSIIEAINDKKYNELSNNMKNIVERMFTKIDEDAVFIAEKADPRGKPDIIVHHNGETHYMSVKSGNNEQVHAEALDKFIQFVKSYGFSDATINTMLLFHYGDGTFDGTGTVRHDRDTLMVMMKRDIQSANEELNANRKFMMDLFARVVFDGNYSDLPGADFIYHGNKDYGVLCSRVQIVKHLRRRTYSFITSPHVGPIMYRPYVRYTDFKEMHPEKRNIVNFKWLGMNGDLSYITDKYDG